MEKHEKDFIKMDIEGAEIEALAGARRVIENNNLKLVLCCYHRQNDEENIKVMLKEEFNLEITKGYMLFWNNEGLENLKPPYFRRGVIRATKK